MKTGTKKLLFLELFLICFLFFYFFLIKIKNIYFLSALLLISIVVTIVLFGFEKNRQRFRKDIMFIIISYTLIFQLLLYILGIYIGFLKNGYNLAILGIIKNIVPLILLILTSEILRYCIVVKGQKNRFLLILSVIIFILVDIIIKINPQELTTTRGIVETLNLVFLPSLAKNILLTYFSYKFGYQSTILYRLIMEIPVYILPIIPNLNNYLNAIVYFLFPLFFVYRIYKQVNKIEQKEEVEKNKYNYIITILSIIILFIIVFFTSGVGPSYALVIGSGSMAKKINVGDVVIVDKLKEKEIKKIKVDDILVYKYDGKVIAHRVIEKKEKDGKFIFKTKGDINKDADNWFVNETDVIGLVKIKIPYIGYPTVWLNGIE